MGIIEGSYSFIPCKKPPSQVSRRAGGYGSGIQAFGVSLAEGFRGFGFGAKGDLP